MANIEYNEIRNDIVEYLKSQKEFQDFNYTAPAISTLIDALAYVCSYMSVYANFSINEIFIETAQKRSSVVSKALNLGYIPHQYTAAFAKVRLEYTRSMTTNIDFSHFVIPIGTTFEASLAGNTYRFRTKENTKIKMSDNGTFYADLTIYEGDTVTDTFIQNDLLTTRFVLANPQIDTSTMTVMVHKNIYDVEGAVYTYLSDIMQLTNRYNLIYTYQENTNGNLELFFGDGVVSQSIEPGWRVVVTYDTVAGTKANNIAAFQFQSFPAESDIYKKMIDGSVIPYDGWKVTTLLPSEGGADREDIDMIRKNAPRSFQRQYRNVIADDYKSDIMAKFSGILADVNVWGGEVNNPPMYGYVMICAKPKIGSMLTAIQKEAIIEHIKKSMVICITPTIIDPVVVYLDFDVNVRYNLQVSGISKSKMERLIRTAVTEHFARNTSTFDTTFNYSKFLNDIFNVNEYINDIQTVTYVNRFVTVNTKSKYYEIDTKIPIKESSIQFGPFYDANSLANTYITDERGILYQKTSDTVLAQVGKVNYDTGEIVLTMRFYSNENIQLQFIPKNNVFSVSKNDIFSLRTVNIKVEEG